jgi:hypothetical protein
MTIVTFVKRNGDGGHGVIHVPELLPALKEKLTEAESLNGLAEKFVAVESVSFVVDQLRQIRNLVDRLADDKEGKIDNYFSQVNFLNKYGQNIMYPVICLFYIFDV